MSQKKEFVPLSLDHQERLTSFWRPLCLKNNLPFSEYSFANNFLFRKEHNYFFLDTDPPIVRGEYSSGHYYYIPTAALTPAHFDWIAQIVDEPITLFPIPEAYVKEFPESSFEREAFRSDADYIYSCEKFKTMKGRSLSSRRNLLHQFEANYEIESKALTSAEKEDAASVLELWFQHSGLPKEKTDYFVCMEALEHLERLGLVGRMAYADKKPVGFIIGELLTPDEAVFHFSKSLHSYKGVTPFLYQDFANFLPSSISWIDLEQDLGLKNLRQAKEVYDPEFILNKYRIKKKL